MLKYFLSLAKAVLLPTDGGCLPAPTPLVTGMNHIIIKLRRNPQKTEKVQSTN